MLAAAAAAAGVVGCDTDNFLPFFPAASVHILLRLGSVGPQKKVNKRVSSVAAAAALPDHLILRGEHGCREVGFLDFAEADDDFDGIHENLSEFLDPLPSLLVLNSTVADKVEDDDDDDSSEDPESDPYVDEQPPPVPAFFLNQQKKPKNVIKFHTSTLTPPFTDNPKSNSISPNKNPKHL